ncbi:MAG: 16S rRNA (uracil(1498)-N(3))-methyltransferase [Clostridia bacterium]|nr:16S rRNA (uracil(1498)-N(3))-methyltransferase [Clostridia bacterium]
MPRFFIRQNQIEDNKIKIIGEDARHISRSLRMAAGEHITVCDMQSNEYDCVLREFGESEVVAEILDMRESENEPPCYIKLYQALPKGDKLDTVIQKAVECGVGEIIPFESERCVVRMKPEAEEKKTQRRNRIAAEAAKQCGRSAIPAVSATVGFNDMLSGAARSEVCLFCYEGDGTKPLGVILKEVCSRGELPKSISVVIGSEGGFSLGEAARCRDAGMIMTGLGKRILRTETASGFVLSCICCFSELL